MAKRLIMAAFAYDEKYLTSPQMGEQINDRAVECYLKNAFVCLKSCALHSEDTEVCLCVNRPLTGAFAELFAANGIRVEQVDFDCYRYPKDWQWALAFYKLCVLAHMVAETSYEKYLLLDTDVYCADDLEDLWQEMEEQIFLYNVGHSLHHHDRQDIIRTTASYFGETKNVVHYGGELVGGKREALKAFLQRTGAVYEKTCAPLTEQNVTNLGDEYVLSLAAAETKIREACPYIFRYWTRDQFYLVSTNWKNNPVALWHLPVEKQTGILGLYEYYSKKKVFPDKEAAAKMLGLVKVKRPYPVRNLVERITGKIKRKLR